MQSAERGLRTERTTIEEVSLEVAETQSHETQVITEQTAVSQKPVATVKVATENPADNAISGEGGLTIGSTFIRYRYNRSFEAKLIQSGIIVKRYYSELKNELLAYKKVTSRISWRHESFRRGRPTAAKFVIRGKTLCLCLALNPADYEGTKYIINDMSAYAKFANTPLLYRIKNPRRVKYAKELIAALFGEENREEKEHTDYSAIPYEDTQSLIDRGLIKIVSRETVVYDGSNYVGDEEVFDEEEEEIGEDTEEDTEGVNISEADWILTDDEASSAIEEGTRRADKTKTAIVNVDTLGKVFSAGERVTLEEIKKRVPYIDKRATYIKVLARGELDKQLTVEADDFSLQAVKMIILTGGKAIRTKRGE